MRIGSVNEVALQGLNYRLEVLILVLARGKFGGYVGKSTRWLAKQRARTPFQQNEIGIIPAYSLQ